MKTQTGAGTSQRHRRTAVPLLALILLAALALRVWGLAWGVPSATHYFSYHPDESRVLLNAVLGIDLLHGRFLPGFYNYGSLHLYLINFAATAAYLGGAIRSFPPPLTDYSDWARLYLIGRMLAVGMSLGTVWLTYAIGARLWGRRCGLISAAFLAVMPLHVQHSHWLVVDVPATFWTTLAIYWSARIIQDTDEPVKRRLAHAAWAGVAVGFATATKYNAVLVWIPVLIAVWLAHRDRTGSGYWKSSLHSSLFTLHFSLLVAFLIGCPGSLLDSAAFQRDLRMEAAHVGAQPGETFADTGSGFVYQIATNLSGGMGWPMLLFALAGLIYAAVRRQRGDGILAAFAVPYYILISVAAVRYARYTIPLLPLLAIWSGRMVAALSAAMEAAGAVGGMGGTANGTLRRAVLAITAAVMASATVITLTLIAPMARTDPRDRALAWITGHGLRGAPAGFATVPWFQTVPLDPGFSFWARLGWMSLPTTPADWRARYLYPFGSPDPDWDASILDTQRPPVVVLSEFDYRDALRLGRPKVRVYLAILHAEYRVGAEFGGYGNRMDTSGPPYDMLYANPATWVFVRR